MSIYSHGKMVSLCSTSVARGKVRVCGQGSADYICRKCTREQMTTHKCKTCNSRRWRYDGLLFHDLRRTGVRNLQSKTPMRVPKTHSDILAEKCTQNSAAADQKMAAAVLPN